MPSISHRNNANQDTRATDAHATIVARWFGNVSLKAARSAAKDPETEHRIEEDRKPVAGELRD
jgi:hypothetical protein